MSLRIANIYFLLSLVIITLIISQFVSFGQLTEGLNPFIENSPHNFYPNEFTQFNSRYKDG